MNRGDGVSNAVPPPPDDAAGTGLRELDAGPRAGSLSTVVRVPRSAERRLRGQVRSARGGQLEFRTPDLDVGVATAAAALVGPAGVLELVGETSLWSTDVVAVDQVESDRRGIAAVVLEPAGAWVRLQRRHYFRVPVNVEGVLEHRRAGRAVTPTPVRIIDVSATGAAVRTPTMIELGAPVHLSFEVPEAAFDEAGQVVRAQEVGGNYHYGVVFEPGPTTRIDVRVKKVLAIERARRRAGTDPG